MPPVDITRFCYASRHPANGAVVRQSIVSVLIEHWRLDSSAGMNMEQLTKVITTALISAPHSNTEHVKHRPCHYRHISSGKHSHNRHHHDYHTNHAMPQHHGSHPTLSTQDTLRNTSVAGFAATELGFLGISLALSMLLLFIGYKIGNLVCKYERSHSRGRGHKGSRARRQPLSPLSEEKQPIYLEDGPYEDPDAVWVVTEPLVVRKFK
ncbi:hypothetical protein GGH93_000700 [Coemansia aciculifera]|nr:hypothetical protein GGH93_000700 [Coemansia aciculifera]